MTNETKKDPPQIRIADGLELRRAIRSVIRAASDDETRPHLCAVRLSAAGNTLRVDATNSHWLARYELPCEHAGDLFEAVSLTLLSARLASHALKAWCTRSVLDDRSEAVTLTVHEDCVVLTVASQRASVDGLAIEIEPWPENYERVVRQALDALERPPSGDAWVGIDSAYLTAIVECFETAGNPDEDCVEPVTIRWSRGPTPNDPIVFRSPAAEQLTVVCMPRRPTPDEP